MAFSPNLLLPAAKVVTLVFGGLVTFLTYKAYRRTGSRSLRLLAVGFGFLLVGAALGGTLHEVAGLELEASVTLQSLFTALGFGVLAYSLYTKDETGSPGAADATNATDGTSATSTQSIEHLRQ